MTLGHSVETISPTTPMCRPGNAGRTGVECDREAWPDIPTPMLCCLTIFFFETPELKIRHVLQQSKECLRLPQPPHGAPTGRGQTPWKLRTRAVSTGGAKLAELGRPESAAQTLPWPRPVDSRKREPPGTIGRPPPRPRRPSSGELRVGDHSFLTCCLCDGHACPNITVAQRVGRLRREAIHLPLSRAAERLCTALGGPSLEGRH